MRRHPMLGALAVAAMIGVGLGVPAIEPFDPSDDEGVRKAREEREIERKRRIAEIEARRTEQEKREAERRELNALRVKRIEQGLDPDTGRPMSRQQRRWWERKGGVKFARGEQ